MNKKKQNSEFTHLHDSTYNINEITAVLIPYITVLSIIYN